MKGIARENLAALPTQHTPTLAPGLKHQVIGWLSQSSQDHLRKPAAEEMGTAVRSVLLRRHGAPHLIGISDLLGQSGQLGVAGPVRRVRRAGVQLEARISLQVSRPQSSAHHAKPQLTLPEPDLLAAETRRAVFSQSGEHMVLVNAEQTAGSCGKARLLRLEFAPAEHLRHQRYLLAVPVAINSRRPGAPHSPAAT